MTKSVYALIYVSSGDDATMKFGDLLHGTMTSFDAKGRGVFVYERPDAPPRPVVVPFTTLGDEIEAAFVKRDKHVFVADLQHVIKAGPDRVTVSSPALDKYPGGLWMHIAYPAQVRFKRDMINAAFEAAGHDERVQDVIPSSVTTHFRNRMDYAVSWDGKIGLKEFGSWARYRDVTEDPLMSDASPKILKKIRPLLRPNAKPGIEPWDNKQYDGNLRYVMIREGKNTGDRLIALIVKDLSRISEETKAYLLRELDGFATSIVLGENPLITDLSVAQTIEPLKGEAMLNEIVNGTTYRIHLNSFFQTNSVMSATLQDVVASFIPTETKRLLDLYCGLGFFGINLAQRYPQMRVSGFEIDAQAIELAKENAQANGVADRCAFTSGPAEDLSWKEVAADIVILDPPRAGLHPRVIKTLLETPPPEIVYVSCNYHKLVEELTLFKTRYRITDIRAVDMFPHTPHVEVMVKMVLDSKEK